MRDSIKRIAQQFIVSHYPEAEIVWVGGSVVSGNLNFTNSGFCFITII
ncbi:hypothetical protein V7147_13925 [Bacillus sp. JJ1521]